MDARKRQARDRRGAALALFAALPRRTRPVGMGVTPPQLKFGEPIDLRADVPLFPPFAALCTAAGGALLARASGMRLGFAHALRAGDAALRRARLLGALRAAAHRHDVRL